MEPPLRRTTGDAADVLADLRRLVEAIDRRVPRRERRGEAAIASDAKALRDRAVSLIERIEAGRRRG